jgi:hypothetical protein
MQDENVLGVLKEILNWTRASSFHSVKALLQEALPDAKSRAAFQMMDGTKSVDQVRTACKMSPNGLIALAQRCTAMGLMEMNGDKKRLRLFDLADFGLIDEDEKPETGSKK